MYINIQRIKETSRNVSLYISRQKEEPPYDMGERVIEYIGDELSQKIINDYNLNSLTTSIHLEEYPNAIIYENGVYSIGNKQELDEVLFSFLDMTKSDKIKELRTKQWLHSKFTKAITKARREVEEGNIAAAKKLTSDELKEYMEAGTIEHINLDKTYEQQDLSNFRNDSKHLLELIDIQFRNNLNVNPNWGMTNDEFYLALSIATYNLNTTGWPVRISIMPSPADSTKSFLNIEAPAELSVETLDLSNVSEPAVIRYQQEKLINEIKAKGVYNHASKKIACTSEELCVCKEEKKTSMLSKFNPLSK